MKPDYDVIVLGGGSAGTAAAASATEAGARTLMVNDGELGGLCILRGCMPTKALLASAHAIHEAQQLEPFAARLDGRVVADFAGMMSRKDAIVARFKRAKLADIESGRYEVLDGRARFAAGGGIEVGDRTISAEGYVIATGSHATRLPIPGVDDVPVLDSDDVMKLAEQPSSVIVQGAGAIGLELAQFFSRIGTEVLLVNRSPLLSHHDGDCGAELRKAFGAEPCFELAVPGTIDKLRPDGAGLVATVTTAGTTRDVPADTLVMATGRRAAVDDLGLEQVGLSAPNGCLAHDEQMRTDNPSIYVAGDSTGSYQILHLANQEGQVAGHNAAGGPELSIDYRLQLNMVFTDPPYAEVGLTAAAAAAEGRRVVVGEARFPETGRAITMETRFGIWKVIADAASGEILGTSIIGPRADDLAHLISTLMFYRGKAADLLEMPWYHPTLSEVLLSIGRDLVRRTG